MADDERQSHREEPIVIKKKRGHGGHKAHGGAWKVAYADFVTAMMAFFIVMWIMASSEKTQKLVSAYFKDPGAFSFITGKRTSPIDLNLKPSDGSGDEDKGKSDKLLFSLDNSDTIKPDAKLLLQAINDSIHAADKVNKMGEELKRQLQLEMAKRPDLKELLSSIKIEMTREGLRIELIESQESLFFEVGSSKVSKKAEEVLNQLAQQIGKLPNYVELEGHTDSRKYSSQNAYTNWELSADRANAARRIFERQGLWEGQIVKVTGFADRKLRTPDNPFDMQNRRISILVRQMASEEFIQNNQNITKEN